MQIQMFVFDTLVVQKAQSRLSNIRYVEGELEKKAVKIHLFGQHTTNNAPGFVRPSAAFSLTLDF